MNTDQGKLYYATGIDNTKLRSDAAESRNILHSIGQTAQQESSAIDQSFSKIAKAAGGLFALDKAKEFARKIIEVRGEVESLEISFETLAGKTKGNALFGDIRQFALQTPMMVKDLAQGAQIMLGSNIEAERIMPILKAIGDISMGDAQKFNSLTLAFSQMSSIGKLMGQDLLQMINAGFNPLSVISEKTGKSIGDLKKEMEDGKITVEMVTDAFMAATSAGGKFHGMLEKQSQGIKGAISNLQGAIEDAYNDIGTASQEATVSALKGATDLVHHYKEIGEILAALVATYGLYKAALITTTALESARAMGVTALTNAEKAHYAWLVLQEKAQKALNASMLANPYLIAAAAVVALGFAIYKLTTYETEAQKMQKRLNEVTAESERSIASEQAQLSILFSRLKAAKEGTQGYEDAKKAILDGYGSYLNGLNEEIRTLKDVEGAYKAITEAAREAAKARAMETFTKEASDTYAQQEGDQLTKLRNVLEKKFGDKTDKNGIRLVDYYFEKLKSTLDKSNNLKINEDFLKQFDEVHNVAGSSLGGGGYSYTTNEVKEIFTSISNSRAALDQAMKDAEDKFGKPKTEQETPAKEAKTQAEYNKKDWEDYKKTKQAEYDAMTEAQKQSKAGQKLASEILAAEKKIQGYNVTSNAKAGQQIANTNQQNDDMFASEAANRRKQEEDYAKQVADQVRDSELEIRQARISAMKEGIDKELLQNQLNYDRLIEQNKRREREMLDSLADDAIRRMEDADPTMFKRKNKDGKWEEIPGARDEKYREIRANLTIENLSPEQKAQLEEFGKIAAATFEKSNKESLDKMLNDVLTYEQQRLKITEEYTRKRNELYETNEDGSLKTDANGKQILRKGVTQGNVEEVNRQETEALKAIDEQFAQREETYQAWCDEIANLSLKQLEQVLEDAKKKLEELEKSGSADPKALAQARAKVNTAQSAVNKANAKNQTNPGKRTIKEWEDLYKTLNDVEKEFESIGDTVGGVVGDIISECGAMASSTLQMINGIVTLANWSAVSIKMTAEGASAAIQTMEKASVILTIISAAMQIAMQIVNLFNTDDKKQEEIEKLQDRIDQLQWELDHQDIGKVQAQYGTAIQNLNIALSQSRREIAAGRNEWQRYILMSQKASDNTLLMQKTAEKLAKTFMDVSYTADKALGEEKYKSATEQLKNIAQQQILIQDQINLEASKKKTDNGAIKEWEQKIEELGKQAIDLINEMVEDIIGDTSTGIAEELMDAFYDAFQAGEDYAEAWGKKVNEIVADVLKRMMVSKFLEEPLGQIFDKYKAKWFKDGQFQGLDAVINSMQGFASDLNAVGADFAKIWENLPDSVKSMFNITQDAEREASQKGIATADQDSVDELNGRATAIQGHTFSIMENTKLLLSTTQSILRSVMNIETETEGFSSRMSRMESHIKELNDTVGDIYTKGIRLKN